MAEAPAPTLDAARRRLAALDPQAYARTRNALDGAVSGLSPYLTHGLLSLRAVLAEVQARQPLPLRHKFVMELGWRAYFRQVWQQRGEGIFQSLHAGPLPEAAYATLLPADLRAGCTGVPAIDQAVHTLYATGLLHNHARLWLASYVVHVRKVHWRVGADWLYGHLLDGDLASNHLSWQWVAGTGSHQPYLFNADNVARFAPPPWHSPGTAIDLSYEAMADLACAPHAVAPVQLGSPGLIEPPLRARPGLASAVVPTLPDAELVRGRDVCLLHPWQLGELPALPPGTLVLGLCLAEFHRAWPWSERRWRFVTQRMAALTRHLWWAEGAVVAAALASARSVRCQPDPHLARWLPAGWRGEPEVALFPAVHGACPSFSQWWSRATRGLHTAADLLAASEELCP
jgi:deoxyribodipyrimidine photo-lyase